MKREMDLCREILLAIEESDNEPLGWINISFPERSDQEVSYHVMLLAQADLITAKDLSTISGFHYAPTSLTWQGHEFLDAARSETLWKKAKAIVTDKAGSLSFDVLKGVLIEMGKRAALSALT